MSSVSTPADLGKRRLNLNEAERAVASEQRAVVAIAIVDEAPQVHVGAAQRCAIRVGHGALDCRTEVELRVPGARLAGLLRSSDSGIKQWGFLRWRKPHLSTC